MQKESAMLREPRTYRYSTIRLVLLIVLLLLLAVVPFVVLGGVNFQYIVFSAAVIGLIMLVSVFSLTRSTTISNDGISTRSLLGESALNWSEINSVSGSGNAIRLHNRDGDVTVAPSPHLPGYPEVIEMIGAKRLDLFDPARYSVMSRNWLKSFLSLSILVLLLGAGIYLYTQSSRTETMMPTLFLGMVALGLISSVFMSVLSLRIDASLLTVRYLLKKIVLKADDVHSIVLNVMQTRTGKSYHIVIFTKQNRTIRFSGIGPGLPVTYLVLRNWHQGSARLPLSGL
jgi:hypothetical protein